MSGSRIKSITQVALTGAADLTFTTWNGSVEAEKMRITRDGNVGIGTTNPAYKLTVNGSVRATQFVADVNTYADFVFEPSYQLASLKEVEASIKAHGHLPGIPSESEVRENGMNVASMTVKLLQKVEELTLHAIEHRKAIDVLQAENAALRVALQAK